MTKPGDLSTRPSTEDGPRRATANLLRVPGCLVMRGIGRVLTTKRAAMPSTPPAAFSSGQRVRVVLNGRNRTPRTGKIRGVLWHCKDGRHYFLLEAGGKKVAK